MKHRKENYKVKAAVAERSSSALPLLLFALSLFALSGQAFAQGYGDGGDVRWERKRWDHDEVPATLPAPVRDAVADWGTWAEESGYNLLLDESRQVFLVVERRDRTAAKQLRVVEDALEVIDELAFAKQHTSTPETLGSLKDAPSDRSVTLADEDAKEQRWGRAAGFDEDRVPVIALVHDQETLDSLLMHWMELRPELDWRAEVDENLVSFISEDPLFAVIVTRDTSRDEWDMEHETAALLTRLMLKRAHGPLPEWVEAGLTWQVETRLFQSIWHFFGRNSKFIASSSHSGWERELRSKFRRERESAGLFDRTISFSPEEWSDTEAYLAWGMAGFVAEELGERLPEYLDDLAMLRDERAKVEAADGTWTYDITALPTPTDQFSALADLIGEDFEERALAAFKRGLKRNGELR
ncbi:MAG: hypothetical protein MK291_11245 [Planctomycetes bacterium]|nr:hypothetical protein [Planctomycetota bacterium]